MKFSSIALILSVVLAGPTLAAPGPGDPRLIQDGVRGRSLFVMVMGQGAAVPAARADVQKERLRDVR